MVVGGIYASAPMYAGAGRRRLASMSEIDAALLNWSDLGVGTRLFISPRTVQTHLTHIYSKLGLTSRIQLVQEAARHT